MFDTIPTIDSKGNSDIAAFPIHVTLHQLYVPFDAQTLLSTQLWLQADTTTMLLNAQQQIVEWSDRKTGWSDVARAAQGVVLVPRRNESLATIGNVASLGNQPAIVFSETSQELWKDVCQCVVFVVYVVLTFQSV
jgi:hypothetical protein